MAQGDTVGKSSPPLPARCYTGWFQSVSVILVPEPRRIRRPFLYDSQPVLHPMWRPIPSRFPRLYERPRAGCRAGCRAFPISRSVGNMARSRWSVGIAVDDRFGHLVGGMVHASRLQRGRCVARRLPGFVARLANFVGDDNHRLHRRVECRANWARLRTGFSGRTTSPQVAGTLPAANIVADHRGRDLPRPGCQPGVRSRVWFGGVRPGMGSIGAAGIGPEPHLARSMGGANRIRPGNMDALRRRIVFSRVRIARVVQSLGSRCRSDCLFGNFRRNAFSSRHRDPCIRNGIAPGCAVFVHPFTMAVRYRPCPAERPGIAPDRHKSVAIAVPAMR